LAARLSELSENPSALSIGSDINILSRSKICTRLTPVWVRRMHRSYLHPHPWWGARACGRGVLLGVEIGTEFEYRLWILRYPDQDQRSWYRRYSGKELFNTGVRFSPRRGWLTLLRDSSLDSSSCSSSKSVMSPSSTIAPTGCATPGLVLGFDILGPDSISRCTVNQRDASRTGDGYLGR